MACPSLQGKPEKKKRKFTACSGRGKNPGPQHRFMTCCGRGSLERAVQMPGEVCFLWTGTVSGECFPRESLPVSGMYGKRQRHIPAGMREMPVRGQEVKKGIGRNGMSCSKKEGMITGNFCGVLLCRERKSSSIWKVLIIFPIALDCLCMVTCHWWSLWNIQRHASLRKSS